MTKKLEIALGSQHAVLLEPLHLKLITENETILDVHADLGYVHRGVEGACMTRFDYKQVPTVVGRVCGLCAITHSTSAVLATEKVIEAETSKRAQWLRMLVLEMDRIHSHMLCLAHTAESAGYEALFMKTMMDREAIMQAQEALTGSRVQFDYATLGGVNRDMTSDVAKVVLDKLTLISASIDDLMDRYTNNPTLSLRYKGVGVLTPDQALELAVTGPLLRATGIASDVRIESLDLPYNDLGFAPIVETGGDVHARNLVRLREVAQSVELIRAIIAGLPEGEYKSKVRGKPKGEAVSRIEAPRGELFYFVKGNGESVFDRLRIRTPTYANLPAFIEIFKGEEYASVPPILASLDPCMSCTAK